MGIKTWSPEDLAYLRLHYPVTDTGELSLKMGKSYDAVRSKAIKLKLKKDVGFHAKKKYSPDDDAFIRMEYPKGDLKALASKLGVSLTALYGRAYYLGVKRCELLVLEANRQLGKRLSASDNGHRFKKGHTSYNKGRKQAEYMSDEAIERTKSGRIQKGAVPPNRREIGSERVSSGYVYVKVCDGKKNLNWKLKSYVVYEQHYGVPVPEDMIVEYIDGNALNVVAENLRLASRYDNVKRNMDNFHALPSDLKQNVKLLNQLKKQL